MIPWSGAGTADFLMTFIHQDHLWQYEFLQIASDAG